MNIRTFTGPSIQEALREARRVLGDDVVLLESIAPQGPDPARITVMADVPEQRKVPRRTPQRTGRYGYPQRQPARIPVEENAATHAGFSRQRSTSSSPGNRRIRPLHEVLREEQGLPANPSSPPPATTAPVTEQVQQLVAALSHSVEKQLAPLYRRLEQLERQLRQLPDTTTGQWASSHLFRRMKECGLRPATLHRIFNTLSEKGLTPESEPETLRWEAIQELHRMLDIPTPRVQPGTLVFLGPSGSGKTTLIGKLASHPGFFGRRKTLVLSLVPEAWNQNFYMPQETFFKRLKVPFLTISTEKEMRMVLKEATKFDQVLIDTPPVSLTQKDSSQVLWQIKAFLEPIVPVEIHLVMNCTCTLEDYPPTLLSTLPINIDGIALTHMDETPSWGRIAEWILRMKRPVRFASMGLSIPESVVPFSAAWFTEELIEL